VKREKRQQKGGGGGKKRGLSTPTYCSDAAFKEEEKKGKGRKEKMVDLTMEKSRRLHHLLGRGRPRENLGVRGRKGEKVFRTS